MIFTVDHFRKKSVAFCSGGTLLEDFGLHRIITQIKGTPKACSNLCWVDVERALYHYLCLSTFSFQKQHFFGINPTTIKVQIARSLCGTRM